jgi:hypothetical protein
LSEFGPRNRPLAGEGGVHAHPLSLYLPSRVRSPYFISTPLYFVIPTHLSLFKIALEYEKQSVQAN